MGIAALTAADPGPPSAGMRRRPAMLTAPLLLLLFLWPAMAQAGGGPFGIDHELGKGDSGIFNRNAQLGLEYGSVAFIAAGSLFLGNDDKLGHEFWQSADSAVFAGLSAQLPR